ncbi:hypothetical protein DM02DRAFT_631693 [Periconia macrospinosa]|uniref:Uncharacterized protein n=1 Tax=Periconia macrospinosa TaxID=97972 RepID=A0A2V1DF76_9PLEO|nr:hypothetical protein DM02DRAFT_631693 [Periconia macrospinosa]
MLKIMQAWDSYYAEDSLQVIPHHQPTTILFSKRHSTALMAQAIGEESLIVKMAANHKAEILKVTSLGHYEYDLLPGIVVDDDEDPDTDVDPSLGLRTLRNFTYRGRPKKQGCCSQEFGDPIRKSEKYIEKAKEGLRAISKVGLRSRANGESSTRANAKSVTQTAHEPA